MLIEIFHRYLMIIVACVALLIGVQAPNLVDQYQKRVDAHLQEVMVNLKPFQDIANQYFGGNMDKLLEMHRSSSEKPFQDEGAAIEKMIQRKARFESELAALNTTLPARIAHVLFNGDPELRDETLAQYSYTVPLNQDALITGGLLALVVLLLVEAVLGLIRKGVGAVSGKKASA
jgi:hypothetical protein